jgi:hypothetical protein
MAEQATIKASAPVDELAVAKSDHDMMRDYFKAQPKETIRIPKDRGSQWTQVNGYTFEIAAGVSVEVPKQIAAMLRDAGVI